MAKRDGASVKYEEHKRPASVLEGDSRLDGRASEMFRPVCKSVSAMWPRLFSFTAVIQCS